MHCPNCGHSAQPYLARCGHCNYKLPETALPGASPESGKIACWNCSHPNDAHVLICTTCNAKTERPPSFEFRGLSYESPQNPALKTQNSTLKTVQSHDE